LDLLFVTGPIKVPTLARTQDVLVKELLHFWKLGMKPKGMLRWGWICSNVLLRQGRTRAGLAVRRRTGIVDCTICVGIVPPFRNTQTRALSRLRLGVGIHDAKR